MAEVVDAGEEAEHEGDGNVEDDEEEVFVGGAARGPIVKEVQEEEGDAAEEGAGCAAVFVSVIGRRAMERAGGNDVEKIRT